MTIASGFEEFRSLMLPGLGLLAEVLVIWAGAGVELASFAK